MSKVLIIGGGAAGMMAAVAAGENGHDVWLYASPTFLINSSIRS